MVSCRSLTSHLPALSMPSRSPTGGQENRVPAEYFAGTNVLITPVTMCVKRNLLRLHISLARRRMRARHLSIQELVALFHLIVSRIVNRSNLSVFQADLFDTLEDLLNELHREEMHEDNTSSIEH